MENYIEQINISESLTTIAYNEEAINTPNLKSINVNASNPKFSSINGVLFSKDKKTLYVYPGGKEGETYTIPTGTETIGELAFFRTVNLKKINMSNTVKKIETRAFSWAEALEEITIPSSVSEMGAGLFEECPKLKKATINANCELLPYLMFNKITSLF